CERCVRASEGGRVQEQRAGASRGASGRPERVGCRGQQVQARACEGASRWRVRVAHSGQHVRARPGARRGSLAGGSTCGRENKYHTTVILMLFLVAIATFTPYVSLCYLDSAHLFSFLLIIGDIIRLRPTQFHIILKKDQKDGQSMMIKKRKTWSGKNSRAALPVIGAFSGPTTREPARSGAAGKIGVKVYNVGAVMVAGTGAQLPDEVPVEEGVGRDPDRVAVEPAHAHAMFRLNPV
ncbi:hypothetical protein ACMD2_14536, partial [Ananas comosus]